MELKVDMPALAGQNIDPATFQRVWSRVMPGEPAARERTSIPDTAVPAVPSEQPPATDEPPAVPPPEETPDTPNLPPVPDCPVLSPVPDCPAEENPNPVPDCPQDSQCPSCPETPECPACPECPSVPTTPGTTAPGTTPTPETPAFCLGEASQGDSARLESLMVLAKAGAAAGRAMSRRAGGSCARTLSALACDHHSAFRRLSAAYFLITGQRYAPKCAPPKLPASLPLALRQQFLWEQQWERANDQAAQATADPCLKELYLELAQEGAFHAGTIRSLLEQMA